MKEFYFFKLIVTTNTNLREVDLSLDGKYTYEIWNLDSGTIAPKGYKFNIRLIIWYLLFNFFPHKKKRFHAICIYHDRKLISQAWIFPKYFIFPHMNENDVQIGQIWTDSAYRGQGFAKFLVAKALNIIQASEKPVATWYIVDTSNHISIHLAKSFDFKLYAVGIKKLFYRPIQIIE